ncbi:SAV_915 family protein [Actinomadura gamaensis]|uniref:SAV_915 family protein n=1 Tax=Actinomadura gamaensis TaxID=1763541 RepID=A0ABV9UA45_9ACTN
MSDVLFVPVRTPAEGMQALVTGRAPDGRRVGIAFSDPDSLRRALGDGAEWTRLSSRALRAMLRPAGITRIQLNPLLTPTHPQPAHPQAERSQTAHSQAGRSQTARPPAASPVRPRTRARALTVAVAG